MARVNVNITARDLTRAELARMRRNFGNLGNDLERFVGQRTRQNFLQLRESVNRAAATLRNFRGAIPDDEFVRLNAQLRQAQQTLSRGFNRVGTRAMDTLIRRLETVHQRFEDLDRSGQIRVQVDTSALQRADRQLAAWRRQVARSTSQGVQQGARDVDGNRFSRVLRNTLMSPLRATGGFLGGLLSDGIGQALVGGLKAAGPLVRVAMIAAIGGAMALAGASMAGALVLGIGAGIVGLGAMFAVKSEEIQRNWKAATKNMGEDLKKASEPLIPVIHRAIHSLEDVTEELAPHLEEALSHMSPALDKFVTHTKDGLRKLGEGAWDNLVEAFNVFLVAFGPEWEDFLKELGKSLGALARTVRDHSTEMAMALRLVLGTINAIIDIINFFATAWVMAINFTINSIAKLLDALAMTLDFFMSMVDSMLAGIESVASVFGFEDEAQRAREAFSAVRDAAVGRFTEMSDKVKALGADIDYNNRKRVLEVQIDGWMNDLARAKEELKSVPASKQSEVKAKIDDLQNKIRTAQAELNSMRKDYYVRIHAYRVGDWALGFGGPGMAHGGVVGNVGRAATGGARSNMTLVGEQGPEIVNLPAGSHVRSNADTRRLLGGVEADRGSTLLLKSSGRRVDDLLIEILREAIHQRGGDPVTVLGGR